MLPDPSSTKVVKALYNLNEDPYEMINLLADGSSDITHGTKVKELENCYQEWSERTTRANN